MLIGDFFGLFFTCCFPLFAAFMLSKCFPDSSSAPTNERGNDLLTLNRTVSLMDKFNHK